MNINEALKKLDQLEADMKNYSYAMSVLNYDGETAAPQKSADARGRCLELLSSLNYRLFANDEVGELLGHLTDSKDSLPFITRRRVEQLSEDYGKMRRVPIDEYTAFSVLTNEAGAVWHEAKKNNDFASFEPYIDRIVETMIRFAGYYDSEKEPYEVLLNEYEKGLTTEYCDNYFARIKSELVPLIKEVGARPEIDSSCIEGSFPIYKQRLLSDYLMEVLTLPRDRCSIGEVEHPFTDGLCRDDVRITTHYHENAPASSMYSVIHEGGHALYELGFDSALEGTCMAFCCSVSMHESQSRFFENIIGRSESFISFIAPKLRELFPSRLSGVSERELFLAVNKAQPSLIRTEADELTYSLHVMIRYEIEKMLFSGEIKAAQLPEVWNRLYKEYLGITVPDDKRGVLQDSHWSSGLFGYFPSYSIGSAYSAQFYNAMKKDLDVGSLVAQGELAPIVLWLRERVHRHGNTLLTGEIIKEACGEEFSPKYYTDYLSEKFKSIYGIA